MLTGGRSAERLYTAWAKLPNFRATSGVNFYFGDERCVSPRHRDSNYDLAARSLFHFGVPEGCSVFRMEADDLDPNAAARRYDFALPDRIDVLLLGVGEDGHIASLFPGSPDVEEVSRRVVPTVGSKPPSDRFTITPPVIAKARLVFVLATGAEKAKILVKAQAPGDITSLPARLVLHATWLLDSPLPDEHID